MGIFDFFFKVEDDGVLVFVEELSALGDIGSLGRAAAGAAELEAAKHTFHADPLADDDVGAFYPFIVGVTVFFE